MDESNELLIKICGITDVADVRFLIDSNIDMMGFIFYPESPRYITPGQAKHILDKLGNKRNQINIVGVFVDEKVNTVLQTAELLKLDYLQLHGKEKPDYIEKLKNYNIIKALQMHKNFKKEDLAEYKIKNVKYLLTDTFDKDTPGGTGQTFEWEKFDFLKKVSNLIISGGLKKENLQDAIDFFNPKGVDINSGVEKEPGIKSKKKIEDILRIMR